MARLSRRTALLVGSVTVVWHPFALAQGDVVSATLGLRPSVVSEAPSAMVELGRRLFFDRRLSADGSISCSDCHIPEKAYSDGLRVARGVGAQNGTRNTPSLLNVAYQTSLFWDGRRDSLEAQATDPFFNPREHGLTSPQELQRVLSADVSYSSAFTAVFGTKTISSSQVGRVLATFERTLLAGDSEFDRYYYGKDKSALSLAAQRGLQIFRGRAQCANCHTITEEGAIFSDGRFHSTGVGIQQIAVNLGPIAERAAAANDAEMAALVTSDSDVASLGRFVVTRKPSDIGQYKTPSLRNVALTAPYMHDGSVATLEEAIDRELYYRSAQGRRPIILTEAEKADLIAFLLALTSKSWPLTRSNE